MVRVHAHIPHLGSLRFILCPLHLLGAKPLGFGQPALDFILHVEGHFQRQRRHTLHQQLAHRLVNAPARNALARRLGFGRRFHAAHIIGRKLALAVVITDRHGMAALGAQHQALQERRPFPRRPRLAARSAGHLKIFQQPFLIGQELLPTQIPRMSVQL